MRRLIAAVWAVCALGSGTLIADVWDYSGIGFPDDTAGTTSNQLVHGAVQVHDVAAKAGVADQDFYIVAQPARTSWEAVIDGFTGDISDAGVAPGFDRIQVPRTVIQQKEIAFGGQRANYLRFKNDGPSDTATLLRVASAWCGTGCGVEDQYTIRLKETTVAVPRFNNSATQVTVLILMNTTESITCSPALTCPARTVAVDAHFRTGSSPTTVHVQTFTVAAGEAEVFNTSTIPALQGIAGGIVLTHNGGYGQLSVKAVALEPATGFSFDTPGTIRP